MSAVLSAFYLFGPKIKMPQRQFGRYDTTEPWAAEISIYLLFYHNKTSDKMHIKDWCLSPVFHARLKYICDKQRV